jgi:hypothetical protein
LAFSFSFSFSKTREFLIKYSFSKIFLQNGDFGGFLLILNSFSGLFSFFFFSKTREFFYKLFISENISHKMANFGDFWSQKKLKFWQFIFLNREFVVDLIISIKKINGLAL